MAGPYPEKSAMSSSTSPTPSSKGSLPKGRAKACTNCRQVKLKCNAKEAWPEPCFRCKSQGSECRMDSSFRRVPARRQLEEVSQKLNSLQRLLNSGQQQAAFKESSNEDSLHRNKLEAQVPRASSEVRLPTTLNSQQKMPEALKLSSSKHLEDSPSSIRFLQLEEETTASSWTLGGITITYQVAKALFVHFDEFKWQHAPFLQPCKSLQTLYATSDLLFWTIILQASRNHGLYGTYFLELLPHHRLLLGAGLLGQYSIATLHALLLVCTWPYPNPRQTPEELNAKILRNRDPVWTLIGAATNMATMMGLHKPGHQEEFGYDLRDPTRPNYGDSYVRNVTWLYVFQIGTSQSSWLGISPPLSSPSHLDTIATICQDTSIPSWMRAKADIQRRVTQFTIQLDTTLDLRTRYSLINVFEHYLDRAKENFDVIWSQELEVDYLGAKLYLYGIAFVNSPNNLGYVPVEDPGIMARNILQRGLTAAVRLCHTVCNMNFKDIPVPGTHAGKLSSYTYQLSWYPRRLNLAAAFATIFLAWFLAVDKKALDSDRQLAQKYMNDIRQMYASFYHSQEHLLLGRKIENLTAIPMTAPKLTVSSRLGASFMYSYNFMYRYLKSMEDKPDELRSKDEQMTDERHANIPTLAEKSPGLEDTVGSTSQQESGTSSSSTLLPDSWDLPWSEWDPSVFEELQNLSWGQSPWDMLDTDATMIG